MVNAGDIFTMRVRDGRYIAVRVLRTRGSRAESSLISATPYLARKRPSLTDRSLREVLTQRRFRFRGEAARSWLDGPPPKCFELVGNLPLTAAEKRIHCDIVGDKWTKSCGQEVVWEARWHSERQAIEAEVRAAESREAVAFERQRRRPAKPGRMIDEDEFWAIIDQLDWKHRRKVLAPAVEALAARSTRDIRGFEERLAYHLHRLDTRAHAGSTSDDPSDAKYMSADGFLYARCAVVAKGRCYYEAVLKRPGKMPRDAEFDVLLDLASEAYQQKTGDAFEYEAACNYESFSNANGWRGHLNLTST